MNLIKTNIDGLIILKPIVFKDNRGYFMESYNKTHLNKLLKKLDFVQDNESVSLRGVIRGLHFQAPPFAQSKLVRCLKGEVLDIALDLRKKSKTYGQFESVLLSEANKKQLFVPKGFAHGFVALSDTATVSYKVDSHYDSNYECGVLWNDPDLNIDWKIKSEEVILSEKDKNLLPLSKITNPFK